MPGIRLYGRRAERQELDGLMTDVRTGRGRILILHGEAGTGKSALLDYLDGRASGSECQVIRVVGAQSEMELAFAGLHQLFAPMLSRIERLPAPQRDALRIASGLAAGPPPDRFLVALAVLNLLAGLAEERPLICLIDDEQWLDRASAQALGFAARRLAASPVGLVFATQQQDVELAGLPELEVHGLRDEDARALLASVLAGPLDVRVRDLIVAETPGKSAGPAGAGPRANPGAVRGRVRPARRRSADRPGPGRLRPPADRPARRDQAGGAASGGRSIR